MAGATLFSVDAGLCTGCGACAKACPMHILEVRGGRSCMTDSRLCLECGECMRACPQHAISIAKDGTAPAGETPRPETSGIVFTHVLEAVMAAASEVLNPQQVLSYSGMDLSDLNDLKTADAEGFARCYQADKLLKMYQSRFTFFSAMCVDVFGLVPAPEYDLPIFMFDWSESEDSIFFICDFYPTDDPGRNQDYLARYLYEPLEELYQSYSSIPGLQPIPLHWVRALNSPYMITGHVEKEPRENIGRLLNCTLDYLRAWLGLWKTAAACEPASPHMQLVAQRRRVLRDLYLENDPGIGSINKFIGEERGGRVLKLIIPE
jgi:NAD-dependent dihydropyrimidine dehydrogenase PreA subunit